jgi:penicillin-binding protein 1A
LTKKLGFKHLVKSDKNAASLALGGCTYGVTPIESAAAFAIFGNGGVYYKPTTYYKIVDVNGNIILQEDTKGKRAVSAATATIMNHLLREVVYNEGGTGRTIGGYNYRMKAYAKTGTSSDTKDSWLVGGTPYYVASVWYGYDHNYRVYNTNAAKNIWRDVMREIHKDLPVKEFEDSEDVYRRGNAYYKKGTSPGKVLSEEDYLPDSDKKDEETSSNESTSSENVSSENTESSVTDSSNPDGTTSDGTSSDDGTLGDGETSTPEGDESGDSTTTPPDDSDDDTSAEPSDPSVTPETT